jgi:transcriptional regulator with XRE-family HTH domain
MNKILLLLGKRISKVRKENGLTQENLALACDLSQQYIGAIECGTKNPTFTTILKISEVLKVSISQLLAIPELAKDEETIILSIIGELKPNRKKEIIKALQLMLKK